MESETISAVQSEPMPLELSQSTPMIATPSSEPEAQGKEILFETVSEKLEIMAEPTPTPTPAPASTCSTGAIPFSLSEGTDLWWCIDSGDSAYWSAAENINSMRSAAGLPVLIVDVGLSAIANSRCEQIVLTDNFSHDGMCTAGEILGQNYNSAGAVCTAWQNSPDHYAAITNPGYTRMGIACWFLSLNGQQYTYWTVVFE